MPTPRSPLALTRSYFLLSDSASSQYSSRVHLSVVLYQVSQRSAPEEFASRCVV